MSKLSIFLTIEIFWFFLIQIALDVVFILILSLLKFREEEELIVAGFSLT